MAMIPAEIIDLETDHHPFQTPLSCRGATPKDPISVENYAEFKPFKQAFIDLSKEVDVEYYVVVEDRDTFMLNSITKFEPGESSSSRSSILHKKKQCDEEVEVQLELMLVCEICTEPTLEKNLFRIKGCAHYFCNDCMAKYVAAKIQDNITSIKCPIPSCCNGVLEPQYCQSILPPRVFDRWNDALCEALILGVERFYCPFKDCSALLVDDGVKGVKESECPHCHRLFCVQCKVGWHCGIDCVEFEKLNKDEREREDLMLMDLARKNQWQRCPKCRFYVERTAGCPFMKCRCGYAFCYGCASPLTDHYCSKCKR
ncbi:hypothetical protein Syun_026658 [Stephania yunnanensis]|uniref:RBR-type E3 ubiquitin transferase n=1 Tax=Stephania yunnanensis TaxID=152371 RepID=A0AAP0HSD9_9MAGN